MKRFRLGGEVEMESITLANVLVLVSRGSGKEERESPARVFRCKTCNRQFPSFQALGGHCASHKKPRLLLDGQSQAQVLNAKRRVHGCSMCGLQFATGQALGGHMRRHKSAIEGFPGNGLEEEHAHGKKVVYLDLNLPPPENEMECIELVGNCFYK